MQDREVIKFIIQAVTAFAIGVCFVAVFQRAM